MLTDTQLGILAVELVKPAYALLLAARDYTAIATILNATTTVENPVKEATTVPVPITLKMLLELVPPSEGAAIYSKMPGYVTDLRTALDNQDREYLGSLLAIAVAGGAISADTAGKLQPLLTATVEVPAPATIEQPGIATGLGLPTVTFADVQLCAQRYFGQ